MEVKDKIIGLFNGVISKESTEANSNKQALAKKVLANVEQQYALLAPDGKPMLNLKDLANFLKTLPKDQFEDYVKKNTNVISVWVTATIGDEALGDKLAKLKAQSEMAKEIESRIKELEPYIQQNNATHNNAANHKPNGGSPAAQPAANGSKEKTIVELLAEEGVKATESAPSEEPNHGASMLSMNDLIMAVERIEGKLDMFDQFRKSSDERIGDLAERIGELRQMLLDKERDFNEVQHSIEKAEEVIGDINPEMIRKSLEKSSLELEKRDAKIEKLEDFSQLLSKELGEYRERMSRIKDFEILMDSLKKVKEEIQKINDSKKYVERMSAKSEQVFAELSDTTINFKTQLDNVKKMDELTHELLLSVDEIKDKQSKSISKTELEKFKDELIKMNLGTTKAEFDKSTKALEGEIIALKEKLSLMEFRTKSVSDLIDEKVRTNALLDKLSRDYSQKAISDKAYLDATRNAKKRLKEIEDTMQRLDRETLYNDLNKITKVVNEHAAKMPGLAQKDDTERLSKLVGGLQFKIENTNVEKSLQTLEEAKSNMFERLRAAEKELRELDLSSKRVVQSFADIEALKATNREYERLISGNLSEIEDAKGILSAMENKIEGEIRQKLASLEISQKAQETASEEKFNAAKKELDLFVRDKIKVVESFAEELKALKQGKSLVFDKMNATERSVNETKESLSSIRNELQVLAPKISSIENDINGSLSPELYAVRSKLSELEALKGSMENIKAALEKLNAANYPERIETVAKSNERSISGINNKISGIQDGFAALVPRIELAENTVATSLMPELNAIKAKVSELDSIKPDINSAKAALDKLNAANYSDKIDAISRAGEKTAAELKEEIQTIQNELAKLGSITDELETIGKSNDKSVSELKEEIYSLQDEIKMAPKTEKLDNFIKSNDKSVSEIKEKLTVLQSAFKELGPKAERVSASAKLNERSISEVKGKLTAMQDDIKAFGTHAEKLYTAAKSNEKSIGEVRDKIYGLQNELKAFGPKLSSIQNNVDSTLSPEVNTLWIKVTELEAMKLSLDDAQNDIEKLSASKFIERIDALAKSTDKSINIMKGKVSALQDSLKTLDPKISTIESHIDSTLSPELEALKSDLDGLRRATEKINAASLTEKVNVLSKQIRQMRDDLYGKE